MPVIEVDGVDAEPLEARLAAAPHVPRAAVNAEEGAVAAAHVAKLGGEDDLLPAVADGAADELLVRANAVHVGGVEEINAELDGPVDRGDRFRLVAKGRNLQRSEFAILHGGLLLRWRPGGVLETPTRQ